MAVLMEASGRISIDPARGSPVRGEACAMKFRSSVEIAGPEGATGPHDADPEVRPERSSMGRTLSAAAIHSALCHWKP